MLTLRNFHNYAVLLNEKYSFENSLFKIFLKFLYIYIFKKFVVNIKLIFKEILWNNIISKK